MAEQEVALQQKKELNPAQERDARRVGLRMVAAPLRQRLDEASA